MIVLSMTQSIHGQEKPTKESRKRDADAVEQRIVKKREEIKLKREANLKERKIRQLELEKENQRQYEELLKKHK